MIRAMRGVVLSLASDEHCSFEERTLCDVLEKQLPTITSTNLVKSRCEKCTFPACVYAQELQATYEQLVQVSSLKTAECVFHVYRLYGYQRLDRFSA
ncbi:hypothetical protein [Magnetococcus sp. PR-3]|uniref:hypothetical protein n=1 Tax=Magnetococcus sp. PR-3 TaxID=3120355 RepID=UPI002FCE55EF